jgi:dolichyl-phosphate beta-glucosyltransferase
MVEVRSVLVVPCYNEAERFRAEAFAEALETYPSLGLLFVNDGSQDQTESVLQTFVQHHGPRAALYSLPQNQGKAEAVREGLKQCFSGKNTANWSIETFEHIGYWDADLATPFSEFPRFLKMFQEHPNIWLVMGARVNLLGRSIHRHVHRHYLGRIFATAASVVLRLPVYDTQCGAKIFRFSPDVKTLFDKPFISGWIFDVELLARLSAVLLAKNLRPQDVIYELPLLHWHDVEGSKIRPKDFLKAILSLVRIAKLYTRKKKGHHS